VALGEIDELALDAARVLDAQDGAPAYRPAVGFDETPGQGRHGHGEALADRAQLLNRPLHGAGALRVEPGAESEHAARDRRRRDDRSLADDFGLLTGRRPRDDDLRFGMQQRVGAVGLIAQRDDLGSRGPLARRRAGARAHQRDRGDDREPYDPESERQRGDLVTLERREGGNDGPEHGRWARFRGKRGSGRGRREDSNGCRPASA